ncbi:hypothetical protein TBLA_0E02740 [Henningerozyma blattae CBS 6284]|uniref:serine--tRNA ligase n=1 Tax=Henningerozyma blattae (strain ATCC 34711 / CBS 6284 / DSM 70876 / NBRC 10599 / NRRL Y-10934 / UCD 77-7) TaxID=1071380 RepID=I2H4M8_HENB6|nr:hypothetical protein TBLA_0E02740 [Tetrapisispora blattae CBS 6284]CCH61330.1 hypothetical protein TBLA_0E02740 [Tetrapisispora blattae CBS 6284]
MFKRSFHITAAKRYILKKPQFDVKQIISNIPDYEKSILHREMVNSKNIINDLKTLPKNYQSYQSLNKDLISIQQKRHVLESTLQLAKNSSSITNANGEIEDIDTEKIKEQLLNLKTEYQNISSTLKDLETTINEICNNLPNLIDPSAPKNEAVIVKWLNPKESYSLDRERDHVKIMKAKKMINFQSAVDITGSSWYFLTNEGADLERALISYAIDKAKRREFGLVIPPAVVKNEIINACGFRPRDMGNEKQIYHIKDTDFGLIATAEIPLAGMYVNSILDLSKGPLRHVGISRSYRSEAGARGKDTKGLYRVHEFSKVELFTWSKPSDSTEQLQYLKNVQCDIIGSLGISAKMLNMPTNDLGASAYLKCDIEAWMPGRGSFGELSSVSNCRDYQSRRLHIKYKNESTGKFEHVHTLNGTAMAVPRVMMTLVENYYNKTTGRIDIPTCLRPYMNNRSYI